MSTGASMPRLRVAVLNRMFTATGGGAENYSIRIVEQLAARHEVHVFAQEIAHQWPGVTYHRVPMPLRRPRWVNQLLFAVNTWRHTRRGFDIVHSHENTWQGRVQTIHVVPLRYNLLAGRSGWRLALRWLKIATSPRLLTYLWLEGARFRGEAGRHHVVLASENLRAQAVDAYPQAAALMSVVTPGVAVPPAGWDRAEARRSLGLPADGPLLLFVANDYERKGLGPLLQAMAQLKNCANAQLVVVGKGGGIPAFSAMARELGLGPRVHFAGPQPDVAPYYRAADLLVHPTFADTFAMVVLEAMAHGVPVVVSSAAYCGISALLQDGEQALLLADPHDASELAGKLTRLLGDAQLQERLSAGGKTFAQAHDWATAARAYEALYLSRHPREGGDPVRP